MKKLLLSFMCVSLLAPIPGTLIDVYTYTERPIEDRFTNNYHLQIQEAGMMNDIQGGFYRNGVWHVYYLYTADFRVNPYGKKFGNKSTNFYHATTTDWIHWDYKGIALSRDLTSYGDVSSGSIFEDVDNLFGLDERFETGQGKGQAKTIISMTTSYGKGAQNILGYYSLDDGYSFKALKDTPIIANEQKLGEDRNMRDPFFFTQKDDQGNTKYIIYNAENDNFGVWVSSNPLTGYERVGQYNAKHPMLECPNLYKMKIQGTDDYKWVMFYGGNSGWGEDKDDLSTGTFYVTGDLDENFVFKADSETKRLDFGPDYYAANFWKQQGVFSNEKVESLTTTAWVSNWNYHYVVPHDGRIGKMSLARNLTLSQNGKSDFTINSDYIGFDDLAATENKEFENEKQLSFSNNSFKLDLNLKDIKDNLSLYFKDSTYSIKVDIDLKNNKVSVKRKTAYKILKERSDYQKERIFSLSDFDKNNFNLEIYLDKTVLELKLPDGKTFTIGKVIDRKTKESLTISSETLTGSYKFYDLNNI
ncbi:levanase [Spiroplasma chinense]|uniref:Levanase n=1 Tax=Spiroplasma chinense TaxID=216932 RepID=A0A5B9Y4B9_9MOLU|nr:glycoside hydrolase family 32 protein [Spiroplasma chinense]QEH61924.1 levanase [Spiroplasma chinense]